MKCYCIRCIIYYYRKVRGGAMKKAVGIIAVLAAALLGAIIVCDATLNKTVTESFFAMNTFVSAEVTGISAKEDCKEIERIVSELDTQTLSRTSEESEIFRINKDGGGEVSGKTAEYFSLLLDVCEKSGGAFDFTLGGVSDLWKFGSNPVIPDEKLLADAVSYSGYKKVILNGNSVSVSDELIVDFGASGKGIALDEIKNHLESSKAKRAVVAVGGSVLLYGNGDFTVGIRNPEGNSGSYIAKLKTDAGCVSTSGSYEQSFEENGRIYHHILDPKTGYPADNEVVSVTIVSDSGLLSDALSTACFVLGVEKGSELADEYGAKAVFITEDKKIIPSDGLTIEITDDEYILENQ